MKKPNIIAILALAAALGAGAQINEPSEMGYLDRGALMYNDANTLGALQQLRHAQAQGQPLSSADQRRLLYYQALATMHTDGPEAALPMLRKWLDLYPGAAERADVLMSVADCVFDTDKPAALKLYNDINPDALPTDARRQDLTYRRAYCMMRVADYAEALDLFKQLESTRRYGQAALFYQGYIHYAQGKYNEAKAIFSRLDSTMAPANMAPYYLSQIYFMEGDYTKALQTARKLLANSNGVPAPFVAEANRVAGQSLFETGMTADAIPYLQRYVAATPTPLTSALYILGISQYNNADYAGAVKSLQPVTADDTAMGQNALVYLGQAQMKEGEVNAAIMAFDRALRMSHDTQAAETAYYNYAVAKYDGGSVPFGSSVKTFEDFLTRYPNSDHADEVRQYIIAGYLTDNNYEAALASIDRAVNPSAQVLAAKQRILYTLGSRDLGAGNSKRALQRLRQAAALGSHDAEYARQTRLALGEALYRNGDYAEAVKELTAFIADPGHASAHNRAIAQFDLGYAYMALKDWSKGAKAFADALAVRDSELGADITADAYNRLGDCHYYLKDWNQAAAAYDKAYAAAPAAGDYALFQKAMMLGYAGDFKGKLAGMQRLVQDFGTSAMLPDAMLEMTEAQLRTGDEAAAIKVWKELIERYPNTPQGRQAYLQMALTLTETGKRTDADRAYRDIITKYPTSDEAAQAAEILKRQAADAGTLDDYRRFIASVENAPQMDDDEAERLTWNAAESLATDKGDYRRLQSYLGKYPDGKYAARATVMLMDHARDNGDNGAANGYARSLTEKWPDNNAADRAYSILAETSEESGRTEDAMRQWQIAEQRAATTATADLSRMGIMRMARQLERPEELKEAAEAILASSATGAGQRNEATFSLGLAQQMLGDNQAAIKTWKPLTTQTDDEFGAQAAVYSAQTQLDSGDAKAAAKTAETFTQSDTPHTYWLARGFIVLSDALRHQGKTYEADEYLRAVRENYPGNEKDIFEMIDSRLK